MCLVFVSLPMHLLRCGLERREEERRREAVRCRVIWSVCPSLMMNVHACLPFALRMAAHGKGRGGSVLFVLVALACFPTGVEGGKCSYSGYNVKAANMGACNTCEASCSGDGRCEFGCTFFYGDYPTLASCKTRCDVRLR